MEREKQHYQTTGKSRLFLFQISTSDTAGIGEKRAALEDAKGMVKDIAQKKKKRPGRY